TGFGQVGEQLARVLVADERAHRDPQDEVLGGGPVHVAAHPVLAVPGPVVLLVPVVEQCGQAGVGLEDDGSAVAAVAARGSAALDELLAAEGNGTVAAVPGLHLDGDLVDELHGSGPPWKLEAGRRPLGGGCAGPLEVAVPDGPARWIRRSRAPGGRP